MQTVINRHNQTRRRAHGACRLCGSAPAGIPQLDFRPQKDGSIVATFYCDPMSTGFDGVMHGGVAAAICDAAMCNVLFAAGITAMTAKLDMRYRRPLVLHSPARISAWLEGLRGGGWWLQSAIHQHQQTAAEASALFMKTPEPAP